MGGNTQTSDERNTLTHSDASALELGMSEIPKIQAPGRERPYVTIVDTGLATAAHLFIGMLELWLREAQAEGDTLEDVIERRIDWNRASAIHEGLLRELETRTF